MGPNPSFATNGLLGAGFMLTHQTPRHRLGQRQEGTNGSEWIYCFSPGGITGQGYASGVDDTFTATMITTANAGGQGLRVGVASVAWNPGDYGWLQFTGPVSAQLAAGTAARLQLNTTATPGVLGSDAAGGSAKVNGLTPKAAQGGAAGAGVCFGSAGFVTGTNN